MRKLIFAFLVGLSSVSAQAVTIAQGKTIQTWSIASLAKLPQYDIRTATLWIATDAALHRYRGPRLSSLIDAPLVRVTAKDGYTCVLTRQLIQQHQPILAISRDGRPLPSERGPTWVIFPFATTFSNDDPLPHRAIWTVDRIESTEHDTECRPLTQAKP